MTRRRAGAPSRSPRRSAIRSGRGSLRWRDSQLGVINHFGLQGVEPFPFFIEWAADSVHPSQDSPLGGELSAFKIEHPDATGLRDALREFGIEAKVQQSKSVRLIATLKTPNREVELS